LRPHELKYWTGTIAQNISVEIDGNAAALLIEFCEYNQWNILHEIHKLSHIATVITVDIIKQYVQPNLEADIFTVLELAVSQNFYALNQAIDALKHKEDISKFLGLLASQVFTLAAIKNSNKNNNIARDMSLAPFLVVKQQSLACKITDHQLSGLIKRLAELDGRVKLGEDGWLLIMLTFNKLFR
jgi:DNA polymerase III delta subunit